LSELPGGKKLYRLASTTQVERFLADLGSGKI
jgi:hypothetical protein